MPPTVHETSESTSVKARPTPIRLYNNEVADPAKQRQMRKENDFIWTNFAEPHAERRRRILENHNKDIKQLMIIEPSTKYLVSAVTIFQIVLSYTVPKYFLEDRDKYSWTTTWLPFVAFCFLIGGTLTHTLFLAIHEVTHNTAFRRPLYNDLLAMFCNLPILAPYAMMFKSYHHEHHRYQGWDGVDTDIPEVVEAKLLRSTAGKLFFLFFQIIFYAFRPMVVRSPKLNIMHLANWVVVLGWWALQYLVIGRNVQEGDFNYFMYSALYLGISTWCTGCFHPISGHFVSEHFVFDPNTFQETYSYYGPLNFFGWNVGYHNEHHDFPSVPWTKLPKVTKIAPEYYEDLEKTTSWPGTLWRFAFDPNVSTFSRVKREAFAGQRSTLLPTTPCDVHSPTVEPREMRAAFEKAKTK